MSEHPTPTDQHAAPTADEAPDEVAGAEGAADTAPAAEEDVAEANRRRMREALDHKRGVKHPDDRASSGGPVSGGPLPPAAGRDFTRRKSG